MIFLYMFRASSAHLQEDTAVYMQHMVLSLSTRVRGDLSVYSLSENCSTVHSEAHYSHRHSILMGRVPS